MIDGGPEFLPLLARAAHDLPEPDPRAAGSVCIRTDEPYQHNAGHDQVRGVLRAGSPLWRV